MQMISPPSRTRPRHPTIFLAGTIDMGHGSDWQSAMGRFCADLPITFYNPRRTGWQADWDLFGPRGAIHPQLKHQILWEMKRLDTSDAIVMWLEDDSISPISLLEMGLHAHEGKVIIGCPPGYARAANVYITCRAYGIPVHKTWAAFIRATRNKAKELLAKKLPRRCKKA
jgi:hypothetical protein